MWLGNFIARLLQLLLVNGRLPSASNLLTSHTTVFLSWPVVTLFHSQCDLVLNACLLDHGLVTFRYECMFSSFLLFFFSLTYAVLLYHHQHKMIVVFSARVTLGLLS